MPNRPKVLSSRFNGISAGHRTSSSVAQFISFLKHFMLACNAVISGDPPSARFARQTVGERGQRSQRMSDFTQYG